jgi:hypothetical protein
VSLGGCLLLWCLATSAVALEGTPAGQAPETRTGEPGGPPAETKTAPALSDWHYGGFLDLGASIDFNFPDNHQFRSRSTTPRANELDLNMAGVYVRKDVATGSPWGMELALQTGQDARAFAFATGDPTVDFADQLRQFGKANVSYLASVGQGLTLQAGLFSSLIGYESLYAKDNSNYSRSWIADFSPYLMFGVNASYPFSDQLDQRAHSNRKLRFQGFCRSIRLIERVFWSFYSTVRSDMQSWLAFSWPYNLLSDKVLRITVYSCANAPAGQTWHNPVREINMYMPCMRYTCIPKKPQYGAGACDHG